MVKQKLTLLHILISVVSLAQTPVPSNPQTLLPYQDQIRQEMGKATDFRHPYAGDIRAFSTPLFKFDGCSLQYRTIQRFEKNGMDIAPPPFARRSRMANQTLDRLKVEFSKEGNLLLSDLDPKQIKVRVQDAHVILTLQTDGGKRSIKQVLTVTSPDKIETSNRTTDILYIHFKEEAPAKRVAEAFSKAIESCRGKK